MNNYQLDTIKTFKYVTEQNSYIYRPIVRFLYEKHMKFEHYTTTISDIFQMLKNNQIVSGDYLESQLQDTLKQLEEWEVIKSRQEKQSGMTIEEFKKRNYTYQVTDLGLEIESLLIRIDELDEKLVGSLNSKQFSLLFKYLEQFKEINTNYLSADKITEIWSNVFDTHKTLKTNATNYLFHIQEAERANLFNSELFLEFKDTFMQYLGTYITELDNLKFKLYKVIKEIEESHVDAYIEKIIENNKPNQILQESFSEDKLRFSLKNKWIELKAWFLGSKGSISDIEVLNIKTNEAIRLILMYANRLSDAKSNTKDKISEYQSLARMFKECASIKEAHKLYGASFGVAHSRSLYGPEKIEMIEDGNYTSADEIWNTNIKAFKIPNMGNRGPKGKSKASTIKNNRLEQQRRTIENIEKKKKEEMKMKELIKDGRIVLSEIEKPLEPFQRKVLLKWIMRTTKMRLGKSKKSTFRTETGLIIRVGYRSREIITIPSTDGELRGYDIEFIIEGEKSGN